MRAAKSREVMTRLCPAHPRLNLRLSRDEDVMPATSAGMTDEKRAATAWQPEST
jgi:hypothetical protein